MSTAPHALTPHRAADPGDKTALIGIVSVLLGLLVGVLAVFALLMWLDARNARDDATPGDVDARHGR